MRVTEILEVKPNDYKDLTRVTFTTDGVPGQAVYLFCKAGNEPQVGAELDGTVAPDKVGNIKFTKTQKPWTPAGPQAAPQSNWQKAGPVAQERNEKVYKADPDKQNSIEKQSTMKAAIEVVNAHLQLAEPKTLKERLEMTLLAYDVIMGHLHGKTVHNGPSEPTEPVVEEQSEPAGEEILQEIDLNEEPNFDTAAELNALEAVGISGAEEVTKETSGLEAARETARKLKGY